MGKEIAHSFDALEDKVYALEWAYMAMAKALHQAKALDLLHLVGALQDCSAQMRAGSHQEPYDLGPVADEVDSLRASVWSLQSTIEE